jgi:hypothetical protein
MPKNDPTSAPRQRRQGGDDYGGKHEWAHLGQPADNAVTIGLMRGQSYTQNDLWLLRCNSCLSKLNLSLVFR